MFLKRDFACLSLEQLYIYCSVVDSTFILKWSTFLESELIYHENVETLKKTSDELNCSSCNCASSVMNRIVCDWIGQVTAGI